MKILFIYKRGLIQFAVMNNGVLDEFEDQHTRLFLDHAIQHRTYCIGPFIGVSKENADIDLVLVREGEELWWFKPRPIVLYVFPEAERRLPCNVKPVNIHKGDLWMFPISKAAPLPSIATNPKLFGKSIHSAYVLSLAVIRTLFSSDTNYQIKDILDDLSGKETEEFWKGHAALKYRRSVRDMIDSLLDTAKDSRAVKYTASKFKGYPKGPFKGHSCHIDKTPEIAFLSKHFGAPIYRFVLNSRIGKPTGRYVVFEVDDTLILEPEYRKLCSVVLPKEHESKVFRVTTTGAVPVIKKISDMKKYGRFVRHNYKDRAAWKRNLLGGLNTQVEIKFKEDL